MLLNKRMTQIAFAAGMAAIAFGSTQALAQRGEDNPNAWGKQYNTNTNRNNNGCFEYRLSADGGDGGMRLMSNQGDFYRASNGSVTGRLCARGRQTIELSKRDPNARVILEINGQEYRFRHGDRGDKEAHNWYRQYFNVDL